MRFLRATQTCDASICLRVAETAQREPRVRCLPGYAHTRERVRSVQDLGVMVGKACGLETAFQQQRRAENE